MAVFKMNTMFFQEISRRQKNLMRFFTTFLLIAGSSVCQAVDESSDFWKKNKELEYHFNIAVNDIIRAGGEYIEQPVRLLFVESIKVKGVIGVAYGMNQDAYINIIISKEWWDKLGVYERKWVMIHETLHDLYNLKHESCKFLDTKLQRVSKKKYYKALEDLRLKFIELKKNGR